MKFVLALLLPWLAVARLGRRREAWWLLGAQLTVLGWIPASTLAWRRLSSAGASPPGWRLLARRWLPSQAQVARSDYARAVQWVADGKALREDHLFSCLSGAALFDDEARVLLLMDHDYRWVLTRERPRVRRVAAGRLEARGMGASCFTFVAPAGELDALERRLRAFRRPRRVPAGAPAGLAPSDFAPV